MIKVPLLQSNIIYKNTVDNKKKLLNPKIMKSVQNDFCRNGLGTVSHLVYFLFWISLQALDLLFKYSIVILNWFLAFFKNVESFLV